MNCCQINYRKRLAYISCRIQPAESELENGIRKTHHREKIFHYQEIVTNNNRPKDWVSSL